MSAGKVFVKGFFVFFAIGLVLIATVNCLSAQAPTSRYDPEQTYAAPAKSDTQTGQPVAAETGSESGFLGISGWVWILIMLGSTIVCFFLIRSRLRGRKKEEGDPQEPPVNTFNPPVDPPTCRIQPDPPPATTEPKITNVPLPPAPKVEDSAFVSPALCKLEPGASKKFVVKVNRVELDGMRSRWGLEPNIGSISNQGLYTAPAQYVGTDTVVRISASSFTDSTKMVCALVTLVAPKGTPKVLYPKTPGQPYDLNPPAPPAPPAEPIPVPPTESTPTPTAEVTPAPPAESGSGDATRKISHVAIAVLALLFVSRVFAAECGDSKYGMPFFATAGQSEKVVCTGVSGAISAVLFKDVRTGNVVTGIHVSGIAPTSFSITVDRSVGYLQPRMFINGNDAGRPLVFMPPDWAVLTDVSTTYTKNQIAITQDQINKLTARINALPASKPASATVTTKVVVDAETKAQVALLQGQIRDLTSALTKLAEAGGKVGEFTFADLKRIADSNPVAFKAFLAEYAPPAPAAAPAVAMPLSFSKAEVLAEANGYTDSKVGAAVQPVADRVNALQADIAPTGNTGMRIARADTGTQALLQDKLKPKGMSKSFRKEALRAALRFYPPATMPAAKPDKHAKK